MGDARQVLARANTKSLEEDIEQIFRLICRNAAAHEPRDNIAATKADLTFFCNALGYGHLEAEHFVQLVDANADGLVDFKEFQTGYKCLNSYRIYKHKYATILRKPGSMNGEQLSLEDLVA